MSDLIAKIRSAQHAEIEIRTAGRYTAIAAAVVADRDRIAAQIEARADEEASSGLAGCLTVAGMLRERASKIRRGE